MHWLPLAMTLAVFPDEKSPEGFPGRWVGRFIWDHGEAMPKQKHLLFRKTWSLDQVPTATRLRISAMDRYALYVNGTYVGSGAARMTLPYWTPYDTYDVTPLLRVGANTIAVYAHYYGVVNGWTTNMRAGLFAQLDLTFPDGATRVIATDDTWRVRPMAGYRPGTPVVSPWQGIACEIRDMAADPADWMEPGFDDSAWPAAQLLTADADPFNWPTMQLSPWLCLEPRRTPPLRERVVAPVRVVAVNRIRHAPVDVATELDILPRLLSEPHEELPATGVNLPRVMETITGQECVSPAMLFDLGEPVYGFPELVLTAPAGAVVDVLIGTRVKTSTASTAPHPAAGPASPSRGEAISSTRIELDPREPWHVGDRLITRAGRNVWRFNDTRTLRFLQVVVRQANGPVTLETTGVVAREYPAEPRGTFACSNPLLTKLWEAGVRTVYLHMEDTHVCDAVRERRQYSAVQELRGGLRGIYAAFGDRHLAEETFLTTQRLQLADGHLGAYSGSHGDNGLGTPSTGASIMGWNPWHCPNQNFGYPLAVWEHYRWFGDRRVLEWHLPALEKLRAFYELFTVDDSLLHNLPSMNFMDWQPHDIRGSNLQANAGYAAMLDAMAEMGMELGRGELYARPLREQAAAIRQKLRARHWDAARGLFVDSLVAGKQGTIVSEVTNAFALLMGVADAAQRVAILDHIFDPQAKITRASPLAIGFVVEGFVRAGAVDQGLALLERFRPMLENSDVPTLCEEWNRFNIHDSPCGLMMTLTETVLGVSPSASGYKACRIEPRLGSLTWAKGTIPAPTGDIMVSWEQPRSGEWKFDLTTPPAVPIQLLLPLPPGEFALIINGADVTDRARVMATSLQIALPGGHHAGELRQR